MKKLIIAFTAFISVSVHAQDNTLLETSFWRGNPDVSQIKAEVQKGNNPSQFNRMSFDPVVLAINSDASAEALKYLLDQPGNDVNKLTHDARTYLHWAASKGNVEIMEYLIAKGAKANIQDSHGTTALNFAASAGQQDTKVYDLCLANGADLKKDVSTEGANALLLAVASDKDFKVTDYFVSKGLSLNSTDAKGNNAFSYAARSGNIDMLKALLKKGVKPGQNAMLMAAQGTRRGANTLEVYQYLETLNLKPAVAGQHENVLHAIVRKPKQNDIIKYFLSKGVDVNQADEDGNTVLINAAAFNRDPDVLTLLLAKVKNINQTNLKGVSALAMAVRSNSPEVVAFLIGKGAAVNTADKDGNNLAYYLLESYRPQQNGPSFNGAKTEDFTQKMKILENAGFKVTTPQKNGNTLYHLAVLKDLPLLQSLQPMGIDVNAKNAEGITALHKAAMIAKDDAMLKYLLSIGAKKELATSFEETAFDLASENESLSKNNVSVNFLK